MRVLDHARIYRMKDKRIMRKESKKCTRCKQPGSCKMEGADLTILYSNDAAEWNSYLMRCFQELQASRTEREQKLHVRQQCLENLVLPLTIAKTGFFRRAKSQIVILSPEFLEFVVNNPSVILGKLFEPSRVLVLMCGVSESEVTSLHRASLVSFECWKKMTVLENDQDFVMRLINTALEMIQINSKCLSEQILQQASTAFRLNPKKAKEGCAKVTVEFQRPVSTDAVVTVSVKTEKECVPLSVKCTNPYNVKFTVPDQFFGVSQYVQIDVQCGNESLGVRPLKCESKMGELNHLLLTILNPLDFMCQTLGLTSNSLEDLDHILVENFTKNVPKTGFSLFDFSGDVCKRKAPDEVPTLLHFAAKMGLRELCTALLDCPGAAAVCQIRNARGLNPADLAETEGHSCLASMLENFTKLSETAEMYTYMKSMTESGDNVDYENLRRFRQSIEEVGELSLQFDQAVGVSPQTHVMLSYKPDEAQQQAPTAAAIDQESFLDQIKNENEEVCKNTARFYSKSQQELLQLLEDFKQDKYTITEVELLFHNWQLRQKCHSFKEKQETLQNMRHHYDHIQKKCMQEGKKSALERFRMFLVRNVKKESKPMIGKGNAVHIRPKNTGDAAEIVQSSIGGGVRPYSNSSNSSRSSSSLSNRSSTLSGLSVCSATDSGAQSDIGEEQRGDLGDFGSPKLLANSLVSRMIENLQYMYTPTIYASNSANAGSSTGPCTKLEDPTVKNIGNCSQGLGQPAHMLSLRNRNPMPFPRLVPSVRSRVLSSTALSEQSLDYITPDENDDSCDNYSLGFLPPPPPVPVPSNSDARPSDQEVPGHTPPPRDGYLLMENSPRSSSAELAPIVCEPDYCNVSYTPVGHYMDMSSPCRRATRTRLVVPLDSCSPLYMNTGFRGSDDSDRCDSVPDVPPPAPPSPSCRPKYPPPLPPRNPGLPRAK